MSRSRYSNAIKLSLGSFSGTTDAMHKINAAVKTGRIPYTTHIMKKYERLDILAGKNYKDSSLWWVIAAASGIGWALQVPPGTVIYIPNDLGQVFSLV